MGKRTFALLAAGSLIASVFSIAPALAQNAPTTVPSTPNIVDAAQDANHHSSVSGQAVGPTLNGADILAVWFSSDAANVYVHIQTTNGARPSSFTFETYMDPGLGEECMSFDIITPGDGIEGATKLYLTGACGDSYEAVGEVLETEGPDATAILTGVVPREKAAEILKDGTALKAPNSLVGWTVPEVGRLMTIDNTDVGTDYTIGAGSAEEPPAVEDPPAGEEPPAGDEPPAAEEPSDDNDQPKKNCKKKKTKKARKKCKKQNQEQPDEPGTEEPGTEEPGTEEPTTNCPKYTPGEQGAEAENVLVTDVHTAEAPLEITITQAAATGNDFGLGVYDETAHQFRNLQVDAAGNEAGLYVRYEFPVQEDHDLYVNYADGTEAAHVGGFNQAPFIPANDVFSTDGTGAGGHSEQGAEQLDGLRTGDCAGYTVDFANFLGEGGDFTVKLWLGEIQNDPAAPAAKSYI